MSVYTTKQVYDSLHYGRQTKTTKYEIVGIPPIVDKVILIKQKPR